MKEEDIKLSDWQRILVGEVPGTFYIEVIIRLAVLYLLLIVAMRLMGKRMASQLSRTEMIAMVTLAAAIGIPALAPDRGLVPAIISAFVIVMGQRFLAWQSANSEKFEAIVQGNMSVLVSDSVLNLGDMETARITRERLFAQLRSQGLYHLGSVKHLIMEPDGKFTLIQNSEPKPGLTLLPEWDREYLDRQTKVADLLVCKNCGNQKPEHRPATDNCLRCTDNNWVPAVT